MNYAYKVVISKLFYSFYTQFLTFEHLDLFVHIVLILMFALREFIVAGYVLFVLKVLPSFIRPIPNNFLNEANNSIKL